MRGHKFTLLLDESTDNANRSQVSTMARWVGQAGLREKFIGLIHMPGTKAVNFMNVLNQFCLEKDLDLKDVRFVALDGCNTMSGEKTGLQRRIRNVSPHSLYVNCRNHKLALCFVHNVKANDHLAEVEGLLVSVWKLFHYSPRKNAVFQSIQEVYNERPLTFIRASATTWLSHLRACERFVLRYECLLDTLDSLIAETHEPDLEGIRAKAADKQIVFTILLLTDVFRPVNHLALYLQSDLGFFTNLGERVKACTLELHAIIRQYEHEDFQDLEFSKWQQLEDIIVDRTDLARHLRQDEEQAHQTLQEYFRLIGIPIIYELVSEIEDAFSVSSPVLAAFSVLDPSNLPKTANEVMEYGQAKIHTLAQHYGSQQTDTFQAHVSLAPPDVSILVEQELLAFRTHMFLMKQRNITTLAGIHSALLADDGLVACFPNVPAMYELIPQSTAIVKRSFSLMNDLCTFLRTSLSPKQLEALMKINFSPEPTDEDLERIIDLFKNSKNREMTL